MKFVVLGRTQWLYDSVVAAVKGGHTCVFIHTAKAAPEYTRSEDDMKELAAELGCDFVCDSAAGNADRAADLHALGADVAISVNWPTLISTEVRQVFANGIINAHPGDLPRYRGNACPNWAILNGEKDVGLALHEMSDGIDEGPIYLKRHYPLNDDSYIGDVYDFLAKAIPEMFVEVLEGLEKGDLQSPRKQDERKAMRCFPRRPEDGLIDWRQPVPVVHRLVRASSRPFAGAFSHLDGDTRVTIWRARPALETIGSLALPGQVLGVDAGFPIIACGDGALRLEDVEIDGTENSEEASSMIAKSLKNRLGPHL